MSDVVIEKPVSYCLVSHPWQKMDKHRLEVRTDAVRHGAFDMQYRVIVLCARLLCRETQMMHNLQHVVCVVSPLYFCWSDIIATVREIDLDMDCAYFQICVLIKLRLAVRVRKACRSVCDPMFKHREMQRVICTVNYCLVKSFPCWPMLD